MQPPSFDFRPMTLESAEQIITWRYEPPYDIYNLTPDHLPVLLTPQNAYHAATNHTGQVIAFCCFGPEAQVPGGTYANHRIEVGAGLRPDAIGIGTGTHLILAALTLASETYQAHQFGATIAAFNQRALRAAERAGFQRTTTFHHPPSGREYIQLHLNHLP